MPRVTYNRRLLSLLLPLVDRITHLEICPEYGYRQFICPMAAQSIFQDKRFDPAGGLQIDVLLPADGVSCEWEYAVEDRVENGKFKIVRS